MAAVRPYFKLGIADLESIFEAASSDEGIRKALAEELRHRSTERAAALLQRIGELTECARQPGHSSLCTRKSEPEPKPLSVVQADTSPDARAPLVDVPRFSTPQPSTAGPTNKPTGVLAAWTALEALSPQTYRRPADLVSGDNGCVAQFEGNDLPWFRREPSRRNYQLYYQVVLGSVHVDRATDELIRIFGEDDERSRREREKAAIAAVLVNRDGFVLEENAVGISSYGWALPIALTGDLNALGGWTDAEHGLVEGLTRQLVNRDGEGNLLPLEAATIQRAFRWLVTKLNLPADLYESPTFVLRVFHYYKAKNPPEVSLLNSFFLTDLGRASQLMDSGRPGSALARYLGAVKVPKTDDLLQNAAAIEALVAPAATPPARWPAPGGHPLVTLQQAAVNAARRELAGAGTGIVAVNGPPGTGKTTLLRDIVAGCVLDRAAAMARFEDPMTAFKTTGQKIPAGDRAFLHLYALDESLKGHEVVVASSNNKAVENISRELPASKAIGRDFSYFKTVSDRLLAARVEDARTDVGEPTWGLIAAVLGNSLNRGAFQQAVWWDDDRSLRLYLKAAKGDSVIREIKNDEGRIVDRVVPAIVEEESPPSPEQARANWPRVRGRFVDLHGQILGELRSLESVRQLCLKLPPAKDSVDAASGQLAIAQQSKSTCEGAVTAAMVVLHTAVKASAASATHEKQALAERPGWLHRLFNTKRMKKWEAIHGPIALARADAERREKVAALDHEHAQRQLEEADATLRRSGARLAEAQDALATLERAVGAHRAQLGDRLVDDQFFRRGHEQWNLASPWLPDELHKKREDLFAMALLVQRSFVDVTAQRVSSNLGVLMGAMQAGVFQDEAKKKLLADLWSTLFMVCPVVSTTFASVNRMFGDLPPESLGWLLVDEAGQATPQSAVGLLMRARRAIVVGDPLQIPPVVSLPPRLVTEVAKFFAVSPEEWLAPEASAQTLADQASRLQAKFRADIGIREVGIPLLVHRRCQEPMFGISNRIAYDGQMVHAAGSPPVGAVSRTLGPSRWFDVNADAESKWCPAEGEMVVRLLRALATAGVKRPDVYVITPFRIIAQELRRRIEADAGLLQRLDVDPDDWLRSRVGTIHTFQGKEAEAVIAVLGAPMGAHQGARRWAASTPNIFNVMVSRAKQRLYVVGSRAAWSTVGHGKAVAAAMKIEQSQPAR